MMEQWEQQAEEDEVPKNEDDRFSDDILLEIFGFVGPHHYRYIGSVNRRWKAFYESQEKVSVVWASKMTSFESAAMSPGRLRICLQDIRILRIIYRQYHESYQKSLLESVARCGTLAMLSIIHI